MALPKVPDSVLEKLRCQCGRYLSTSPISVNQDGRSVCSICVDSENLDVERIAGNSAYEAMAELFRFPCRYKAKGCHKYMQFNTIAKHEEECTFRTYECPENPLTPCNAVHSVAQLSEHYQQHHPELYLRSPTLLVDLTTDSEKNYLTTVDKFTYLLQTKCSITDNKLWLHVSHFRDAEDTMYIHCQIKLIDSNNRERYVALEKKCVEAFNNARLNPSLAIEIDISAITSLFRCATCINCLWDITVASELKHKTLKQKDLEDQEAFEENKESLKCLHCGVYMVPPIYRCDKSHITCEECRAYYGECRSCQSNEVNWTRATDLENIITQLSQYRCRWLKCNQMFSRCEIRKHEQECGHRRYKCPNCNWLGIYDEILSHFKSVHSCMEIYSGDTITFNSIDRHVYIIAHHEIFSFIIKVNSMGEAGVVHFGATFEVKFSFEMNYLSFPKFLNDWEFIINGCKDPFRKKHQLLRTANNCYAGDATINESRNSSVFHTEDPRYSNNYQLTIIRK